jgi:hypothetical protein
MMMESISYNFRLTSPTEGYLYPSADLKTSNPTDLLKK